MINPDFSVWWGQGPWLCLLLLAALAIWAFRTALGGRSVLAEP
ncbi:MAG: hypothetical protein ACE5GX_02690 [Thermoanaerobaculia bacterium]